MAVRKTARIQSAINNLEIAMLAYGAICAFLIVFYISQSVLFSLCMVPAGVGGTCIALIFNRQLMRYLPQSNVSPRKQIIGASIMPILFLALCVRDALNAQWAMAGGYIMLLGFSLFIAWQHLQYLLNGPDGQLLPSKPKIEENCG